MELVERARSWGERTALRTAEGAFSYADLLRASQAAAEALLQAAGGGAGGARDLEEARVVYLVPPGFTYVAIQWGIWRAGGVAVPLALSHPPAELAYVLDDAQPALALVHPDLAARLRPLCEARGIPLLALARPARAVGSPELPAIGPGRRALMIYTSGTTSRPKGAVLTHGNIEAQVRSLVLAWEWTTDDRILSVLPLHHIHGVVNVLTSALFSGAQVTVHERFDPQDAWRAIASGELTLFMAVPTIYARLLSAWEEAAPEVRARMTAGARRMRLMVSGSAALPVTLFWRWREATGHELLERYGMTEVGMALSNPLRGERRPGTVGRPLPGVGVRLVDEAGRSVAEGQPGEIEVRGPNVFLEYWRRPEATRAAFRDGWFRTGDLAVVEGGYYRILGRQSVDIIKTGGFKVSALEVEEVLREHPLVAECAVVGVPDPEWGERVAAAIVPRPEAGPDAPLALSLEALRAFARERLAPYKIPTVVRLLPELPRNAMGKVVKPDVRAALAGTEGDSRPVR